MAIKASNQVSLLDITDAYSVTLTSEAFTFVGNTTGAPSGLSCTTQAVAYCGATKCSKVTIGTVSCPTGISATISNNNTESPTITFKTTATITAACEATIPVTVDGIIINKKFSFAVAKTGATGPKGEKGETGATGPQGPQGVKGDTGSSGKGVKSTAVTYQAGSSGTTAPTGTWSSSVPSTSSDKPYLWTRTIITYTDNTTSTSYSVGVPPNSVVSKGEVVKQVNSELKIDGNCIDLTTGHFTINSENMTLDKKGNATFSGTITGASGEFTKGFNVDIPDPVSGIEGDDSSWRMSIAQNDMFIGRHIYEEILDEPPYDKYESYIRMRNGSFNANAGNRLCLDCNGSFIDINNANNTYTLQSNSGASIALSSNKNVYINSREYVQLPKTITETRVVRPTVQSSGKMVVFGTLPLYRADLYNINSMGIRQIGTSSLSFDLSSHFSISHKTTQGFDVTSSNADVLYIINAVWKVNNTYIELVYKATCKV